MSPMDRMSPMIDKKDAAIESIATRIGVPAERGRRFADLTSLRVGGALWMNAGAYGQEIGTVVDTVRVARGGRVIEIPGSEVQWNYRHTSFREGEMLLGATLSLHPDEPQKISERMEKAKSQRMATQPHGSRSAGCFFKNAPASPVGTGKMIDDLGMKGTG